MGRLLILSLVVFARSLKVEIVGLYQPGDLPIVEGSDDLEACVGSNWTGGSEGKNGLRPDETAWLVGDLDKQELYIGPALCEDLCGHDCVEDGICEDINVQMNRFVPGWNRGVYDPIEGDIPDGLAACPGSDWSGETAEGSGTGTFDDPFWIVAIKDNDSEVDPNLTGIRDCGRRYIMRSSAVGAGILDHHAVVMGYDPRLNFTEQWTIHASPKACDLACATVSNCSLDLCSVRWSDTDSHHWPEDEEEKKIIGCNLEFEMSKENESGSLRFTSIQAIIAETFPEELPPEPHVVARAYLEASCHRDDYSCSNVAGPNCGGTPDTACPSIWHGGPKHDCEDVWRVESTRGAAYIFQASYDSSSEQPTVIEIPEMAWRRTCPFRCQFPQVASDLGCKAHTDFCTTGQEAGSRSFCACPEMSTRDGCFAAPTDCVCYVARGSVWNPDDEAPAEQVVHYEYVGRHKQERASASFAPALVALLLLSFS